jgi:GYF domain 2
MASDDPHWYVAGSDGQSHGPFSWATLLEQVREGLISPTTPVWRIGMESWVQSRTIPGLLSPPPLPKSWQTETTYPVRAIPPTATALEPAVDRRFFGRIREYVEAPSGSDDAIGKVKTGSTVGYIFAGAQAFSAALFLGGFDVWNRPAGSLPPDELFIDGMTGLVLAAAAAGLAYWLRKRNSAIAACILLVWFAVEVAFKVGHGKTNTWWLIAYCSLSLSLIASVRGARYLRRQR